MIRRRGLAWAILLFVAIGALSYPASQALTASKVVAAGKLFQPPSCDGWFSFSAQTTHATSSWLNTVRVFNNLHMTPGDTFPTLGLGVSGGNMTATTVDDKSVTVTLTVPILGTAYGYLYAPGYYDPDTVTGALTHHWYDANKTLVFTRGTTGSVTVSWGSPETDTILWGRVFPDSFTILSLLAIVVPAAFVVSFLIGGKDPMEVIGMVGFMVLISLAALIISHAVIAF